MVLPSHWKSQTSKIVNEVLAKHILGMGSKTWKASIEDAEPVLNKKLVCILIDDMTSISEAQTQKYKF